MGFLKPRRGPIFSSVEVQKTTTLVLASQPSRTNVLLVNDSDQVIYLMFGADAVLNEGIRLNAEGGSYELSIPLGTMTDDVINAIHNGDRGKNLLITERNNR